MTQILKPKMWREKNTQTQRHRNIEKQTKRINLDFGLSSVACELRKGRNGLNAVSSTLKH